MAVNGTVVNGHRRSDPERHKAQVRASNRARYKAVQELIARYPDEFADYLELCNEAEGVTTKWGGPVTPAVKRRRTIQRKQREARSEGWRQANELRKVRDAMVVEARLVWQWSYREITECYGISQSQIRRIVKRHREQADG